MKRIFCCVLLAALTGCGGISLADSLMAASEANAKSYAEAGASFLASGGTEETLIAKAKKSLTAQLKDPDSANFRNVAVREVSSGVVVCGELNAKNSYGGYTGFTRFVAGPNGGDLRDEKHKNDPAIYYSINYGIYVSCGM